MPVKGDILYHNFQKLTQFPEVLLKCLCHELVKTSAEPPFRVFLLPMVLAYGLRI